MNYKFARAATTAVAAASAVGFNLFVLQGTTGLDLLYVARVTLPMFVLMIAAVLIICFVPGIVTWLPQHMTM
jgi:C4-dicarboxylate transporter DctM subunit